MFCNVNLVSYWGLGPFQHVRTSDLENSARLGPAWFGPAADQPRNECKSLKLVWESIRISIGFKLKLIDLAETRFLENTWIHRNWRELPVSFGFHTRFPACFEEVFALSLEICTLHERGDPLCPQICQFIVVLLKLYRMKLDNLKVSNERNLHYSHMHLQIWQCRRGCYLLFK